MGKLNELLRKAQEGFEWGPGNVRLDHEVRVEAKCQYRGTCLNYNSQNAKCTLDGGVSGDLEGTCYEKCISRSH